MYTLIFADGTTLEGLTKTGGGNWFSETPIDESIFTNDTLAMVRVIEDENETILRNQHCDFVDSFDGGYSFNLRNQTDSEMIQDMIELNAEAIVELAELIGGGE